MKSTLAGWHRFLCTPAMTFSLSSEALRFMMSDSGTNTTIQNEGYYVVLVIPLNSFKSTDCIILWGIEKLKPKIDRNITVFNRENSLH